jgi:DNA-binding response OmpR family regulator
MRPRVLIVEDDLQTREALRQVLEREGCEIDLATDGQKAIGCLAQHRYDVILLDVVLPKISGTEVMEYIASTTPEQLEFVIVVTGLEVGEIRKLFPSVRDALAKPVMPTRLLASVRRLLAPRDSRQSGASVA